MAEFTFHHGGVSVPSLEAAIDWYGDVLGFELEKRFYIEAANAKASLLRQTKPEQDDPNIAAAMAAVSGKPSPTANLGDRLAQLRVKHG